jgi:uncharacterized protein YbaR (Trm112 family)
MRADVAALVAAGTVVCPSCRGRLETATIELSCGGCGSTFPVAAGVPVLLTDDSLFTADQVLSGTHTYYERKIRERPLKQRLRRSLPSLAGDASRVVVDDLLRSQCPAGALGLVLGGGERVQSMERRVPAVDWLVSDVDLGYGPDLVADAQATPLDDAVASVVVAEMVLEHVLDPVAAAREMQRVCREGGVIVATVPFCFPWHGIPYDFHRWTPSGLRAMFDWTEPLHLGAGQGPAGAVAYLADALVVNLARRRATRMALAFGSRFAFGWLKGLDRRRTDERTLVSAGSLTYVGRKLAAPLPRRDLIRG